MTVENNINQIVEKICEESSYKKWVKKFDGLYVYQIIHIPTDTVVRVGFSKNFEDRIQSHYHRQTMKYTLAWWCRKHNKDIEEYKTFVMDFIDYEEELDEDDVKLVEKVISYHNQETIFNTDYPKQFNAYQLERLEYIYGIVNFNFVPYEELNMQYIALHSLKKSNKKVLSLPTKRTRNID